MGTRHRQAVINSVGELKIQQYGQWDGYPEGQGVDILNYLNNSNINKYQDELNKIPIVTEEELEEVDKDENWKENYPYLSRDCGARIHQMIEDGLVKFVDHVDEHEAKLWCEGFYTIDFQKGVFISEYNGEIVEVKLNKLPTKEEYLKMFNRSE